MKVSVLFSLIKRVSVSLVMTVLFCVLIESSQAQQLPSDKPPDEKPMIRLTSAESVEFFKWVMGLMDVGLDENKHMSVWTKDRISWMFIQNEAKQLTFHLLLPGRIIDNQQVFAMASGYVEGKADIEVNLSLLGVWFWDNYQLKTPIDRARRNDLAIMLSHEVAHLQHGSSILEAIKTNLILRTQEEKRTWTVTVLEDIRPLVRSAEKLNDHFVAANEALLSCKGDPDCPAFSNFIEGHTKK